MNKPNSIKKSPRLGPLGAEPPLFDTAAMFQESLHRYAEEIMRPVGTALDRMAPDAVVAADSPYWEARRKFVELGFGVELLLSFEPAERAKMMSIFFEELGWGDAGLSISFGASMLPAYMCAALGRQDLLARYPESLIGCWGITEPDHGSDSLDPNRMIFHAEGKYGRPNCIAAIEGDEIVINGQKSAWVSNGTIADVCVLYCAAATASGPDHRNGFVVIVPMDARGVSRGKPLDKLGQRALNQGEVFFDDVRLSLDHVLAGPDTFQEAVYIIHTAANGLMGAVFTGVGRAAFEMALEYAHERKQGGVPIIRHQSVAQRLFHMFRKVEASRALVNRVLHYNFGTEPALHAGMAAKITGTQTSFEVASDALQIFGGNGLTREYPIEKLLRDARASLIEDGCNEILSIKGGYYLADPDRL
ncbi:acyl-CoA dehydrogenase family protein [Zoogloea dura]|uniref:Acyl-CoA dehydrogenase n=1 Tax=Zoogloea dura TaxID=2728840 RepID=A0A848GB66_9RHOO|nr:acyl-CoA dehydrogenase [Zoogloea dura]NML28554.1 acyl-CoA dehydrogenase [Zoogloea dura]